jgi:general nucleoside transport system ATP-binding protein
MEGITKRFGPVVALDNVSLSVRRGTIHALVGENGAGKTTLMKILYGAYPATEGRYSLNNQPKGFRNSAEAIEAGIGMVSQHYSIIGELTCLENLMLGAEPGWLIAKPAATIRANQLADQMGFKFDWDAEASGLSPAGAQKLEILKLLWRDSRIMILDEPTAMLTPQDSDALFASLKSLVAKGATVIVVTHRLPEVIEHCNQVTVLRGGRLVSDEPVDPSEVNLPARLAELIVGHKVTMPERQDPTVGESVLSVKQLEVKGSRGEIAVRGASFELRQGEIVGLAGVDGSGQRELFAALYGSAEVAAGELTLEGKPLPKSTRDRLSEGICWIPEDRHHQAVIEDWSLDQNAAIGHHSTPPFARGAFVNHAGRRQAAQQIATLFKTKFGDLNDPISSLSGGNQQRFVNARAFMSNPKVILAFQPARGLDIDATRAFYEELSRAVGAGAAALVVSFDLDELLQYVDRILVMNLGEIFEAGTNRDRIEIGRLMVGAA